MAEATSPSTKELQTSVRQLSLNDTGSSIKDLHRPNPVISTNPNMKKSKAAPVVADSWEDEDSSSESGPPTPTAHDSVPGAAAEEEEPLDPPPTPISPQLVESHGKHHQAWPTSAYGNPSSASSAAAAAGGGGGPAGREPPSRRPEKQTAVAGRMIAGALGVRAPKRTEEQRAYDRSVKEQEIRRRNREREEAAKAVEEDEKAKAAVWDD